MSEFLYEMHTHTRETSRCAAVDAHEVVREYINAGYDGIVITDHMSPSTFARFKGTNMSWKEKVDLFLSGYHEALEAADGRINILLGMELRFDAPDNINDYLVYGLTEEFLYEHPDILNMKLRDFSILAHENKMLIYQAHPFRYGMKVVDPKYLNGVEVYNGNPRHRSNNSIADMWAKKHDLLRSSGSDYHEENDVGRGGMYFSREIKDNETLVRELLHGEQRLKRR